MKGMIFTEFLDMVCQIFSPEMVEKIIDESHLPNQGAYTDVGTYDHQEMIRLITALSKETGISIPELQIIYGKHLFKKLFSRYPHIIKHSNNVFEFLNSVDGHIHVEVLKLYPEAELPRFQCEIISSDQMTMAYHSNHPFQDLAEGLIQGAADHFHEKIHVQRTALKQSEAKKYNMLFTLTREH